MITNFKQSNSYKERVHQVIPGGAHTYSKGDDQWPEIAPSAIKRGEGCFVWDVDDNKYLDCSMGLTSVSLGHGYPEVVKRITEVLPFGVNFQKPSFMELEMAEKFLSLVPCHEMIKFSKNGSTATTAAIKLARAYTNRMMIALPKEHAFFSYDDWFIETTACSRGTHKTGLTLTYSCHDLSTLENLFKAHPGKIACVISEPEKNFEMEEDYLEKVINIAHANGAIFIQDEMVTGFKTGLPGTIVKNKTTPDIATWGKGIANGFSFCAMTGKKEIMNLGGIQAEGEEKLFLTSTTHGGETTALAAASATIDVFQKENVVEHNHKIGRLLIDKSKAALVESNINDFIKVNECEWMIGFTFLNKDKEVDLGYKTYFLQEMIKRGILFQGAFVPCFSHKEKHVDIFINAFKETIVEYEKALNEGLEGLLVGPAVKPVFRKFN